MVETRRGTGLQDRYEAESPRIPVGFAVPWLASTVGPPSLIEPVSGVVVIHSGIMAQPLLTIIAEMYAKPGKEEALREVLLGMIGPTKKEAGYVQYDMHVDNDDPTHFLFYENWTSRALLDAHIAAPHIQAFMARQDELLTAPVRLVFATRQS